MKITVLGEGAWGTALATLIARNGHEVVLWCASKESYAVILDTRENKHYMPGYKLQEAITPITDIQKALEQEVIVITTPVLYLRKVLEQAACYVRKDHIFIFGSKGIEYPTLLLPHEVFFSLRQVQTERDRMGVLSGPSFAHEVMDNKPTAVMLAAHEQQLYELAQNVFANNYFMLEHTEDLTGTALCGAFKNVAALGAGFLQGAYQSEDIRAWFVTKILGELEALVTAHGGSRETISSLAGIGDLVLTSYSTQSRNFRFGQGLGQGKSMQELEKEFLILPEGTNTIKSIKLLQEKLSLDLPISTALYEIFFEQKSSKDLLQVLKQ